MKCLIPEKINEVDLISSSVPIDETEYDAGTTYNMGERCRVGLFIYEAGKDNLVGIDPETNAGGVSISKDWTAEYEAVEDPDWLVVGMVNRWRQFDSYVSTVTEAEGMIEEVFVKPYVDTLYFLNIYASYLLVQVLSATDTVLWEGGVDLRKSDAVLDEWEYCWKPIPEPVSEVKVEFGLMTGATDKIRVMGYGY